MAETGKLIDQQQDGAIDSGIRRGLRQFATLPSWLVQAKDSQRVSEELSAAVPEFRTGGWQLLECDAGHIRCKGNYWTGQYRLAVRKPGRTGDAAGEASDEVYAEDSIILLGRIYPPGKLPGGSPRIEGRLGVDGWLARLPRLNLELYAGEAEGILSAIKTLADPEASRQMLEDSIRANSPAYPNLRIQSSTPNIVRYKPGSRCTVVYHLEYDPLLARPNWPGLVVAKTYRGEKGRNAFDSMTALWHSPLGSSPLVKIAEPLAYLPELKVLVQGPVQEEKILKDVLAGAVRAPSPGSLAGLSGYMHKTAAGLAALHQSGVKLGKEWIWEDELAGIQEQVDELSIALPALGEAAAPLIQRLKQLSMEIPPDPFVPSHGTFRPAQVLINQDEIGFIDFDSFCQSEPANDLGLFLAAAFSIALNLDEDVAESAARKPLEPAVRQQRFDAIMTLHDQFIAAYQQYSPVTYQRVVLWEALDIFTYILHGWTKVKIGEIEDLVDQMERFLLIQRVIEAR